MNYIQKKTYLTTATSWGLAELIARASGFLNERRFIRLQRIKATIKPPCQGVTISSPQAGNFELIGECLDPFHDDPSFASVRLVFRTQNKKFFKVNLCDSCFRTAILHISNQFTEWLDAVFNLKEGDA